MSEFSAILCNSKPGYWLLSFKVGGGLSIFFCLPNGLMGSHHPGLVKAIFWKWKLLHRPCSGFFFFFVSRQTKVRRVEVSPKKAGFFCSEQNVHWCNLSSVPHKFQRELNSREWEVTAQNHSQFCGLQKDLRKWISEYELSSAKCYTGPRCIFRWCDSTEELYIFMSHLTGWYMYIVLRKGSYHNEKKIAQMWSSAWCATGFFQWGKILDGGECGASFAGR